MPDALVAITERLFSDYPNVSLGELIELVRRCRNDIDTGAPEDCIPELVERLARVRLGDLDPCNGERGNLDDQIPDPAADP